jgi:uroporphyrinogen decarboxylase
MNSRERILTTLSCRQPDRVPFDLGSTQVTGINRIAYQQWRRELGLKPSEPWICDVIQQLPCPENDFIDMLRVDVRGLFPGCSHNWKIDNREVEGAWEFTDEWGILHHRLRPGGFYYSMVHNPLADRELTPSDIRDYSWPDASDPERIAGLSQLATEFRNAGKAVALKGIMAGIFEMAQRLRGMENLLLDMSTDESLAGSLFDKLLELKLSFWKMALPQLADVVDVIIEVDDYGTQTSQIISPSMFRNQIKPRLRQLFGCLHSLAPQAKIFFHSCGNIRPLLPDFIELGIDIINPVHTNAKGMEPLQLKRDFGKDIVFWGGGIDTQQILPRGTPLEVKDAVHRAIDVFAPGGGYVFATIHNIQADVPVRNLTAMWEALQEFGEY